MRPDSGVSGGGLGVLSATPATASPSFRGSTPLMCMYRQRESGTRRRAGLKIPREAGMTSESPLRHAPREVRDEVRRFQPGLVGLLGHQGVLDGHRPAMLPRPRCDHDLRGLLTALLAPQPRPTVTQRKCRHDNSRRARDQGGWSRRKSSTNRRHSCKYSAHTSLAGLSG
jgi:hypothetical protein